MNINFLDARRESFENRNNIIAMKQNEIAKLQKQIKEKENKLLKLNDRYFNDKAKTKEYNTLIDDIVKLRLRLHTIKNELTLFEQSYKFEYDVNRIVAELKEQADKAELQKRIENIEAKLQEARKEAESLAKELFEYDSLIVNTVNVYKANVSESNADLNKINEAKQVIYNLHNSPVSYLVKDYPAGYYTKHESIFK